MVRRHRGLEKIKCIHHTVISFALSSAQQCRCCHFVNAQWLLLLMVCLEYGICWTKRPEKCGGYISKTLKNFVELCCTRYREHYVVFWQRTATVFARICMRTSLSLMSSMVLQQTEVFPLTDAFAAVNVGWCARVFSKRQKLVVVELHKQLWSRWWRIRGKSSFGCCSPHRSANIG